MWWEGRFAALFSEYVGACMAWLYVLIVVDV